MNVPPVNLNRKNGQPRKYPVRVAWYDLRVPATAETAKLPSIPAIAVCMRARNARVPLQFAVATQIYGLN